MDEPRYSFIKNSYNLFGNAYCNKRIRKQSIFNDCIEYPILKDFLLSKAESGKKALDIGCGPGIYTSLLSQYGCDVVALDISEIMIENAKKYCIENSSASKNDGEIEFITADFDDFCFFDERFDLILATFMISYFDNLPEVFSKIRNILSKDGFIFTSMLHPIRVFSSGRNDDGYILGDYFSEDYYESDFLSSDNKIMLKKYNFEDISTAANYAGLKIDRIIEPKANISSNGYKKEDLMFYSKNPSIAIFIMSLISVHDKKSF